MRTLVLLSVLLLGSSSTLSAQWGPAEFIVRHADVGARAGVVMRPMQIDRTSPSLEVLEIAYAWGWTWFIPMRLPSPGLETCRDIPLIVPEAVPLQAITIRDVDGDGWDDVTLYMASDNSTRAFFGRGWNLCRRPGEP